MESQYIILRNFPFCITFICCVVVRSGILCARYCAAFLSDMPLCISGIVVFNSCLCNTFLLYYYISSWQMRAGPCKYVLQFYLSIRVLLRWWEYNMFTQVWCFALNFFVSFFAWEIECNNISLTNCRISFSVYAVIAIILDIACEVLYLQVWFNFILCFTRSHLNFFLVHSLSANSTSVPRFSTSHSLSLSLENIRYSLQHIKYLFTIYVNIKDFNQTTKGFFRK
jgi:hypothetical protein